MELFLKYSLFFLQNIFVGLAALLLASSFFSERKNALYFVFLVSLWVLALILMPQIFLGIFGLLNFWSLFITHFFLALAVFLKCRKNFKERFSALLIPLQKSYLKKGGLSIVLMFFAFVSLIFFFRLFNATLQVPVEYDNLAYHLPFAVQWMKSGAIFPHYYSAFAGPLAYYPSNFELLDLYVMLPFSGDYLVNLLNFPFYILSILAFFAILRQFKIESALAAAVSALFVSMPILMRQLGVPLVDLLFTYSFLISLYFLIDFVSGKNVRSLLPFAFSLGLFIGTKYLGLVYAAVLVLIALVVFVYRFWHKKKLFWSYFFKVSMLMILGGGFWYIRNFIDTGNPLFPVDLEIFSWHLKGYGPISDNLYGFSILSNLVDLNSLKYFLEGFVSMVGPQAYPVFLAGAACFFFIFFAGSKKNKLIFALLFLLQLVYIWLYFRAPYSYNNLIPNVRYALMYLVLGFIALAYVLQYLKINRSLLLVLLFLILHFNLFSFVLFPFGNVLNNDRLMLDFAQIFTDTYIFVSLLLSILIFSRIFKSKSLIHFVFFFFLSYIVFHFSSVRREDLRQNLYANWYGDYKEWHSILEAAEWLNDESDPKKIAYTGFNFHYPLYGRALQNELDYVNINDCFRCKYKDFALMDKSIRTEPNYDNWLDNLKNLGKEYVVVEPQITENVKNHEFDWMNEHPDQFKEVYRAESTYIYKVL